MKPSINVIDTLKTSVFSARYAALLLGVALLLGPTVGCGKKNPSAAKGKKKTRRYSETLQRKKSDYNRDPKHPAAFAIRQYLLLSGSGDLTQIKPYVDPNCANGPVGMVSSTKVLGSRMSIKDVGVKLINEGRDQAQVDFYVEGSVQGGKGRSETSLGGKKVLLNPNAAKLEGVKRRGTLFAKKRNGKWQVTCPARAKVKAGFVDPQGRIIKRPGMGTAGHKGRGPTPKLVRPGKRRSPAEMKKLIEAMKKAAKVKGKKVPMPKKAVTPPAKKAPVNKVPAKKAPAPKK